MIAVIDASVAVEILLKTQVGLRAAELVADATLFAPDLIDAEVLAVLRREVLRGRLAQERAAEALDDLRAWDIERMPNRSLVQAAWSYRDNVSAYDALYLAAAKVNDAAVLTADGPLSRAPTAGVVVQNVRVTP